MRLPIHQALSGNALQRLVGAGGIIDAKGDAVRVAKIKFAQVAVQVLLRAVLIDALHAALENRKVAFNGIRGALATGIFHFLVVHLAVAGEFFANVLVPASSIRHQVAFAADVHADDRQKGRKGGAVDVPAMEGFTVRCAWGPRDGMKRVRECVYGGVLDLET